MKREIKVKGEIKEIKELVRPTLNRIFVELIEEEEMFTDVIYKPKNTLQTEPYCNIVSVGEQVSSIKAGDIGLMRIGLGADVFKIYGKKYAILTEFDIVAIIEPEICDEMRKNIKDKNDTTLKD